MLARGGGLVNVSHTHGSYGEWDGSGSENSFEASWERGVVFTNSERRAFLRHVGTRARVGLRRDLLNSVQPATSRRRAFVGDVTHSPESLCQKKVLQHLRPQQEATRRNKIAVRVRGMEVSH